jgi:hypothetical protein
MEGQISIEKLSDALGGKIWAKDNMKRIYINRGYNTKKMSTKTYVYQLDNGSFSVNCYINCQSQTFAWVKSQQQEIVNNVMQEIKAIINPTIDENND